MLWYKDIFFICHNYNIISKWQIEWVEILKYMEYFIIFKERVVFHNASSLRKGLDYGKLCRPDFDDGKEREIWEIKKNIKVAKAIHQRTVAWFTSMLHLATIYFIYLTRMFSLWLTVSHFNMCNSSKKKEEKNIFYLYETLWDNIINLKYNIMYIHIIFSFKIFYTYYK